MNKSYDSHTLVTEPLRVGVFRFGFLSEIIAVFGFAVLRRWFVLTDFSFRIRSCRRRRNRDTIFSLVFRHIAQHFWSTIQEKVAEIKKNESRKN